MRKQADKKPSGPLVVDVLLERKVKGGPLQHTIVLDDGRRLVTRSAKLDNLQRGVRRKLRALAQDETEEDS